MGYVAIAQGDFDDAVTLLSRAADPLARTGYSWGPLSLMLLTKAPASKANNSMPQRL